MFMDMEGRGFSDLLRNTSEEIFLKTMMENPIGITAPSMEMLGFKNISQSFRGDSEELFNNWLTSGETSGYGSSVATHRARQPSRRLSTDPAPIQQNGVPSQKKNSDDNPVALNLSAIDEHSNDPGQFSLRNAAEKGLQSSNMYLAKAWFHSNQPMTRSRSSELRRRYAAMQSSQMATLPPASDNIPAYNSTKVKQEFTNSANFCDIPMAEMPNQIHSFMSPSTSSTSFNTPPRATTGDNVSSVVSMLKGTLERKRLNSKVEKETAELSSSNLFSSQETMPNITSNQVTGPATSFHMVSPMQVTGLGNLARVEKSLELSIEGFLTQANQTHMEVASQEPSLSESSTAAPEPSTGFDACDGPAHSGHTISNCVISGRHVGDGTSDYELKTNDYRERMFENSFKDSTKKSNLVRVGSITSANSVDTADPTKKRRVERSRKMAEAKERNSSPALPSDMQAVLKRCETLEKEVRSLKLNLSFMNRKDSEQTKQIEELHKQNDDLANEKGRLLEEIERIMSVSGQI
ncbi:uncharacterized protein LOC110025752 isoform X2 [Phalaenopsis equestris]|uniref:uncharacterized protein LOC110025752 isoform X2 n=1 Tax=Phalaenopsis equestris TaxID=78828 RepID=UPI0009E596E3|nr:uncharacterized protein LOC110025752 isoform X2 [Phalaenopsis equestris]